MPVGSPMTSPTPKTPFSADCACALPARAPSRTRTATTIFIVREPIKGGKHPLQRPCVATTRTKKAAGAVKKNIRKPAKPAKASKAGTGSAASDDNRGDRSKRLLDLVMLLLRARTPVTYREVREQFTAYQTGNPEAGLRAFERDKADLLD